MSNHYVCLGVGQSASIEEIKKAYRKLALKHHPDKSKAPDSVDKFKKLVDAYDVLSDPVKKQEYDKTLVSLTRVSSSHRQGPPPPGAAYYNGYPSFTSHFSGGARTRQTHFKPSNNSDTRPNSSGSYNYGARNRQFYYQEEDDFDFLYKRNQTKHDSFSNTKSYFGTNTRQQQQHQNQRAPNNGRFGSHFHRANVNETTQPPPSTTNPVTGAHSNPSSQYNYSFNNSGEGPYTTNKNVRFRQPPNASSNYNPSDGTYVEPGYQRQSSVPPHQVPPSNNYRHSPQYPYQAQSSNSYSFTHGSTSMPSVSTDPLPKSWQKQRTNFKNPPTQQPPSNDSTNQPAASSTSNLNKGPSPPSSSSNNNIPVPPNANNIGVPRRPKTPPSNNRPLHPTAEGPPVDPNAKSDFVNSPAPGLKFDMSNFKNDLNKSTPQNIRTQKRTLNKKGRRGIPALYNSKSPSSVASSSQKFSNTSGRPSRTTLEESNHVEFVIDSNDDKKWVDDQPESDEDDDIIEIDELTFEKIRIGSSSTVNENVKKQKPNPKNSSLDLDELSKTTPLTQTNGNFDMNDMKKGLKEYTDDTNNGEQFKRQKTVDDSQILNFEKLAVHQYLRDIEIPKEPTIINPQNKEEYDGYKDQLDVFLTATHSLKKKLTQYLSERLEHDERHLKIAFRSSANMDLYEEALTTDSYVQMKLSETSQAIIKVMNDYKKYKVCRKA